MHFLQKFVLVGIVCWIFVFFLFTSRSVTTTQHTSRSVTTTQHADATTTTAAQKQSPQRSHTLVTSNLRKQKTLINSCDDVVIFMENEIPEGSVLNIYSYLNDLAVAGGQLVVPGHPLNEQKVEEDHYAYFQTCIPNEAEHHHFHNIRLIVTATSGDPDLFVSATRPNPTLVDSTWLSKKIGGETITLPSNHPDFPPGTRTLYFGVGSRKGIATFSVSVDILDRKNKYQHLRLRSDDFEMQREKEHETWRGGHGGGFDDGSG